MNFAILIPTWDRPHEVNKRLREINDLWNGAVHVRVQVNPGQYGSADIDPSLYQGLIEVRQNPCNYGMVANIVCGLEGLDAEWIWILGDDDQIRAEAPAHISAAFELQESHRTDMILFNQWHQLHDPQPLISSDLDTLLRASGFSDILFISGSLWRLEFFRRYMSTFVDYSFSRASQALMILASQQCGESKILIRDRPLIVYEYVVRWSRLDYLQRITAIFVHPSLAGATARARVTEMLWPQCRWAIQSAAYEQLKRGEITLLEWLGAAMNISQHLVVSCPPLLALRRIAIIFSLPFKIYHPGYLFQLVLRNILPRRNVPG